MILCGGSAVHSGRRGLAFARGVKEREPSIGRARLASLSTGRWDLTFKGEWFVFQESSITLGERRVQSPLCEFGARYLSRKGKVRQGRPAAGLIVGAAQTCLRTAMPRL